MNKYVLLVGILCVLLFCSLGQGVQASGLVTFQVEVLPGFKISSPGSLTFEPVAPGNTNVQDLNITVWSNIGWQLSVQAQGDHIGEGFNGIVEVNDSGFWYPLSTVNTVIQMGRDATGHEGFNLKIPFRFTGSYEDCPGQYSLQVEFTVVSAL